MVGKGKEAVSGSPLFQWTEVTIDCQRVGVTAEFWGRLLLLERLSNPLPGWARSVRAVPGRPVRNLQPVPEPKLGKSRVHLDLRTDDLPAAVRRVQALAEKPTSTPKAP
jgi:hypothetical protein